MNRDTRQKMTTRAGTSAIPKSNDHHGWMAHWFKELTWAMEDYRVTGNPLSLWHADRSARLLHHHAVRARPSLRPPRPGQR